MLPSKTMVIYFGTPLLPAAYSAALMLRTLQFCQDSVSVMTRSRAIKCLSQKISGGSQTISLEPRNNNLIPHFANLQSKAIRDPVIIKRVGIKLLANHYQGNNRSGQLINDLQVIIFTSNAMHLIFFASNLTKKFINCQDSPVVLNINSKVISVLLSKL